MNKGFTLAEVLITLGIIGIVAAMTLPTLVQKNQEKVTVDKVKVAYSLINQAYMLAKNQNGDINYWFTENSKFETNDDGSFVQNDSGRTNQDIFWDKLSPYLKIATRCKANESTCKKPDKLYTLTGNVRNIDLKSYSIINLANGMTVIGGWISNINCKEKDSCGDFAVDINGIENPPNSTGKDIFYFSILQSSISTIFKNQEMETYCNIQNTSESKSNGYACTRWIISNENMDYLHCSDLSWEGKTKCK